LWSPGQAGQARPPSPPRCAACYRSASSSRATLPLVARYGDACHLPDLPGTAYEVDLKHKLDVLRRHCDDAGRDYARIEKTVGTGSVLTDGTAASTAALLARLRDLSALGFEHAMVAPRGPWTEPMIDAVASILPEVRALAV
jgi:hypothetical protein